MPTIEERVAFMEGQMSEHSHGLIELREAVRHLEQAVRHLDQKMDSRFAQVDARFVQVDTRFDSMDRRFSTLDDKVSRQFIGPSACRWPRSCRSSARFCRAADPQT